MIQQIFTRIDICRLNGGSTPSNINELGRSAVCSVSLVCSVQQHVQCDVCWGLDSWPGAAAPPRAKVSDPKLGQGELKAWIRRKTNQKEKSKKDGFGVTLISTLKSHWQTCHLWVKPNFRHKRQEKRVGLEIKLCSVWWECFIIQCVLCKSRCWSKKAPQCHPSSSEGHTFCFLYLQECKSETKKPGNTPRIDLQCDWPGCRSRETEKASVVSQQMPPDEQNTRQQIFFSLRNIFDLQIPRN